MLRLARSCSYHGLAIDAEDFTICLGLGRHLLAALLIPALLFVLHVSVVFKSKNKNKVKTVAKGLTVAKRDDNDLIVIEI